MWGVGKLLALGSVAADATLKFPTEWPDCRNDAGEALPARGRKGHVTASRGSAAEGDLKTASPPSIGRIMSREHRRRGRTPPRRRLGDNRPRSLFAVAIWGLGSWRLLRMSDGRSHAGRQLNNTGSWPGFIILLSSTD